MDMKSVVCNSCGRRPSSSCPFNLTDCMHINCDRCKAKVIRTCASCGKNAKYMIINNEMPSAYKDLFKPITEDLSLLSKEFQDMLEFQRGTRELYIHHITSKQVESDKVMRVAKDLHKKHAELTSNFGKLKDAYMKEKADKHALQEKLKVLLSERGRASQSRPPASAQRAPPATRVPPPPPAHRQRMPAGMLANESSLDSSLAESDFAHSVHGRPTSTPKPKIASKPKMAPLGLFDSTLDDSLVSDSSSVVCTSHNKMVQAACRTTAPLASRVPLAVALAPPPPLPSALSTPLQQKRPPTAPKAPKTPHTRKTPSCHPSRVDAQHIAKRHSDDSGGGGASAKRPLTDPRKMSTPAPSCRQSRPRVPHSQLQGASLGTPLNTAMPPTLGFRTAPLPARANAIKD